MSGEFSGLTSDFVFGGQGVSSRGWVSGSPGSEIRTYLVLNIERGIIGSFLKDCYQVGDRWMIDFPLVRFKPNPTMIY